jgi:hypothetical protein
MKHFTSNDQNPPASIKIPVERLPGTLAVRTPAHSPRTLAVRTNVHAGAPRCGQKCLDYYMCATNGDYDRSTLACDM